MGYRRARTSLKKKRRRWFGVALGLLFGLLLLDYFAYPFFSHPTGQSQDRGENGLWLRYTWYFGQQDLSDIPPLAQRLQDEKISYAYFHVRDITKAGRLRYHCPASARGLISSLHRRAPTTKIIAWVYAGNSAGLGTVDLSQPAVRKAMVSEARWLTTICGFDGVQWDYEICPNDDPGFLMLLRETRLALPTGKLLAVAAPMWLPRSLGRIGWSESYFTNVAVLCDQIAVMCYDTGFYFPRGYVWLIHQEVVHVTSAIAKGNPRCRVLIGVPTYSKGGLSHNPFAENIRMALIGVREGLADPGSNVSVFAGVALFADYTTQPSEWTVYQRWWLKKAVSPVSYGAGPRRISLSFVSYSQNAASHGTTSHS